MKIFKKALALTLAGSMMLSSLTAFAAPAVTVEDKGAALYELGLVQGYSDTTMDLRLENEVTREEAVKLVLSMMGYTVEEVDQTATPSFTDVPAGHWAAPYIALAEELGITSGISETEFGLGNKVSVHEVVTFMLRVLGHDSVEAWTQAAELGLSANIIDSTDLVKFDGDALRADFTDVAYDSLSVELVDSKMTLVETLIEDGAIDAEEALELGLIEVVEFGVESVEALNLVQFEVKFSAPVDEDSATDLDNYEADGIDLKDADAELVSEDTVVITLDLTDDYEQQVVAEITVKDVKNIEEVKIPEYTTEIEFFDSTYPEVVGVEVVGNDAMEVTFSEPLDINGLTNYDLKKAFELKDADDDKVYVDDVDFEADQTVALVTFNVGDSFEEDTYELTVAPKLDDFAGFTYLKEVFSIDVVKDEEAPFVVDTKDVTLNGVTLVFNEPLSETPDTDDVYHTNSNASNKAKTVEFGDSKSELVITFKDDSNLSTGHAYVFIDSESIEDLWENENDQTIRVEVEVPGDDEDPTFEELEIEDDYLTLKVTFSEELDSASATDRDNYTVVDEDDEEIGIKTASLSDDEVTLVLRKVLEEGKEYTLKIEDVEDLYGNEIDTVEYTFTPDDVKVPVINNFTAKLFQDGHDQTLVIYFGEEMDTTDEEESVLNLENYRVWMQEWDSDADAWKAAEFVSLSDIDDISIDAIDDGESVEITIDTEEYYQFVANSVETEIEMARVKDASGNASKELSGEFELVAGAADLNLVADSFVVKGETTAEFKVDGILIGLDEEEFTFEIVGGSTLDDQDLDLDFEKDGDETVVTITIEDKDDFIFDSNGDIQKLNADGTVAEFGKLRMTTGTVEDTVDKYGNKLSITNEDADDEYAPELEEISVADANNNGLVEITATFTEPLSTDANLVKFYGTDLKIELGNDELSAADYQLAVSGSDLVITVTNTEYNVYEGDVTVEVIDDTYIRDTSDNAVEAGETKDAEFDYEADAKLVTDAYVAFDVTSTDFLNGNTNATSVKTDLLTTWTDADGVTYTITAAANAAVANDGTVSRPAYDETAATPDVAGDVTVTISKGAVTIDKDVSVTVLALTPAATGIASDAANTVANWGAGVDVALVALTVNDDEGNAIVGKTLGDFALSNVALGTATVSAGTPSVSGTTITIANMTGEGTITLDATDVAGNVITVTLTIDATDL